MTLLSEKLEELNIDENWLTETLKRLVEYKKLENKPRNGANSYYNITYDSQHTEQIQDITIKLEAIKRFVNEQFYIIKKPFNNQSEHQRNKEFIELLQQQNKNLVESKKSKATITQMLVENQNNLDKVNSLNRIQHKKLKLLHKNQAEN